MTEQQLRLRLEALGTGPPTEDWADAVNRSSQLRRRNRLTIAIAVAAAVIVAAPTIVVATRSVDFGSAESAPEDYQAVFDRFNQLSRPAGVDASQTRVVSRPTLHGRPHMLMVAPRRGGGFCFGLIEHGRGGGLGCADAGKAITTSGGGDVSYGSVGVSGATHVELLYRNRAPIRAEVVWVSEPIEAGFFAVGVPTCPNARGVVARDAEGRELVRRRFPWSRC
jgi:hypothetical protein